MIDRPRYRRRVGRLKLRRPKLRHDSPNRYRARCLPSGARELAHGSMQRRQPGVST